MLNLIPIQFLAIFAYFILRVGLGILLLYLGNKLLYSAGRGFVTIAFSISSMLAGILLILGFLTQVAALLAILLSGIVLFAPQLRIRASLPGSYFWLLVIIASFSLFITGAGAFAYDLPI